MIKEGHHTFLLEAQSKDTRKEEDLVGPEIPCICSDCNFPSLFEQRGFFQPQAPVHMVLTELIVGAPHGPNSVGCSEELNHVVPRSEQAA